MRAILIKSTNIVELIDIKPNLDGISDALHADLIRRLKPKYWISSGLLNKDFRLFVDGEFFIKDKTDNCVATYLRCGDNECDEIIKGDALLCMYTKMKEDPNADDSCIESIFEKLINMSASYRFDEGTLFDSNIF